MLNELIGAVIQVVIFALIPVIIWFITARKKETFFYWIGFRRPAQGKWLKTVFIYAFVRTALSEEILF